MIGPCIGRAAQPHRVIDSTAWYRGGNWPRNCTKAVVSRTLRGLAPPVLCQNGYLLLNPAGKLQINGHQWEPGALPSPCRPERRSPWRPEPKACPEPRSRSDRSRMGTCFSDRPSAQLLRQPAQGKLPTSRHFGFNPAPMSDSAIGRYPSSCATDKGTPP